MNDLSTRRGHEKSMRTANLATCCLEIEFTLKPGKRREFARSFEDLNCPDGKGHIKNTIYEDRDEPGHMFWVAAWSSREALEAYLQSDQFGVLIGGLKVLSVDPRCQIVDGLRPEKPGSIPEGRIRGESSCAPIDLGDLDGPIH